MPAAPRLSPRLELQWGVLSSRQCTNTHKSVSRSEQAALSAQYDLCKREIPHF
jgi:hypothetical protein